MRLFLTSLMLLALSVGLGAQVPNQVCYQGNLSNSSGVPVEGLVTMTFRFYNVPSGGTDIWSSGSQSVTCEAGMFSVYLGAPPMPPIGPIHFLDSSLYLGITVGTGPGVGEQTPRTRLVTQPYAYIAFAANTAESAYSVTYGGVNSSSIADGSIQFGDIGQNGAAGGQVIKWNGTAWVAANDSAGGAGAFLPLTGGTLTGSLTIAGGNLNLDSSTATYGNIIKGGALFIHNKGIDNIFAGKNAGNLTLTGYENTAVGRDALHGITTGHYNTAMGAFALATNAEGDLNTAYGAYALESNTWGTDNTATGAYAMYENTSGTYNSAYGRAALQHNTTGANNAAFGANSLFNNSTANGNSAFGASALTGNSTGHSNTAVGQSALGANHTGNLNTAVGSQALLLNNSGFSNTGCGLAALASNSTGSNNTALGAGADVDANNLSNVTVIGAGATVNASNKIRLGNTSVTVIEGQVAYTYTSDRNSKENFLPVDGKTILESIRHLDLTSWNYKGNDPQKFRHYGPTAQDFFAAFGHDAFGQCGDSVTINSGDQAGIMLAAIKQLNADKHELQAQNEQLKVRLEKLEAALAKLLGEAPGTNSK